MNKMIIAGIVAILAVAGVAGFFLLSDDGGSDQDDPVSANIYLDMNDGSFVESYKGSATDIKGLIEQMFEENEHTIDIANNGKIVSVDGKTATDDHTWVLWKWTSGGWKLSDLNEEVLEENGKYMICFSTWTTGGGNVYYEASEYEPEGLPVYVLLVQEDKVLWMYGEGGTTVSAVRNAFNDAGIEFDCLASGWVGSIDGRTQNVDQNPDTSYIYHTQFRLVGKNWIYNDLVLSGYDLNENNVFAFVWGYSYADSFDVRNSTPLSPHIAGYQFVKYQFDDGTSYDVRSGYTEKNITAVWKYELSYNDNVAGETIAVPTSVFGTSGVTVGFTVGTRDGYTFSGWSTSPDGAMEYSSGGVSAVDLTGPKVLYAVWTTVG